MIADRVSVSMHFSTSPSQSFLKNEIERRVRETENADSTPLSVLYVHLDSFLMFYPVTPYVYQPLLGKMSRASPPELFPLGGPSIDPNV